MRHDIPDVGKMSEQYPHLIFNNLKSKLGARVSEALKLSRINLNILLLEMH
jgi:U3 small nucleolar ribonucleoprotein protein IMP4